VKVLFIHGWSVRDTATYGELPAWLGEQTGPDHSPIAVQNIYLGKYISFEDSVTVDDIARAFRQALEDELGPSLRRGETFACVTHSTGGPVIRHWLLHEWGGKLARCPMSHLVMLAPANHGSALAQLGKSRLCRVKAFFQGVEPGQRVLDWLELGSDEQWALNDRWLELDLVKEGIYPFVLTGQTIDRKLYDVLNSYTGEPGSDGVVRVAAANLNYRSIRMVQKDGRLVIDDLRRAPRTAFGVLPGCAHSGDSQGILRSVTRANAATHPTAQWVLQCLRVNSRAGYRRVADDLEELTTKTQIEERIEKARILFRTRTFRNDRHTMLVFRLVDDRGHSLGDYDLYLTAGPGYDEQALPPGFFQDRQRNQRNRGQLTLYLNQDVMEQGLHRKPLEGKLGILLRARPESEPLRPRLVSYRALEYHGSVDHHRTLLSANETTMIEIQVERRVDVSVFRLSNDLQPSRIDPTPTGRTAP
jgi:hypothetical protein